PFPNPPRESRWFGSRNPVRRRSGRIPERPEDRDVRRYSLLDDIRRRNHERKQRRQRLAQSPRRRSRFPNQSDAIGIDEVAGKIYYGEPNGSAGFYQMDLNGENDELILNGIVPGLWSFNTLAIDGENGFVYYADELENSIR